MEWYHILLIVFASLILLNLLTILITSFVSFKLTFYVNRKKPFDDTEMPLGDDFSLYKEKILSDMKLAKKMQYN